jgi:hypothetical protein
MTTQEMLTDRLAKATHYRDTAWQHLIDMKQGRAKRDDNSEALSRFQRDYWDGYAKAINEALDLLEQVSA